MPPERPDTDSPHPLRLRVRRTGPRAVLELGGELDLVSAPALRGALDGLAAAGLDELVVDLRELTFLGSTGLHVLDDLDGDGRRGGFRVAFVASEDPGVRAALEWTGLGARLRFVDPPA